MEFSDHPTFITHASIVVGLVTGIILFDLSHCIISRSTTSFKISSCLLLLGGILSLTPGFMIPLDSHVEYRSSQ